MAIDEFAEDWALMIQLLNDVANADEYHVGYSEGSIETNILRKMAGSDLIHWCPYPDECYIITPAGRALLSDQEEGNQ